MSSSLDRCYQEKQAEMKRTLLRARICSLFFFVFVFFVFVFVFFVFKFIYLWLCWVFVSVQGLSLVVASGGHSSSRCAGLSLSRPLLLRSTGSRRAGSVIVAHGPSRSAARGIFPDQGSNPCPLHWQADSQPLHRQGSPCIRYFKEYIWSIFFWSQNLQKKLLNVFPACKWLCIKLLLILLVIIVLENSLRIKIWILNTFPFLNIIKNSRDFPGGAVVKNPPAVQGTWVRSLVCVFVHLLHWEVLGTVTLQ